MRDNLTGLYNRHFLNDTAPQIIEKQRRLAVSWGILYIDIDHFKSVNDKQGYAVSGDVLKIVANIFRNHVRESDFIVRYGGDEFIILVTNVQSEKDLSFLANRLCNSVETAFEDAFHITFSIGSCFVEIGSDLNLRDVIKVADNGLYKAKEAGRNQLQSCI